MLSMRRIGWALAVVLAASAGRADAEVVVTAVESGGNVVLEGGGTLDLTGLTFYDLDNVRPSVFSLGGLLRVGPADGRITDVYSGVSGPGSFGTGREFSPSAGSGDLFGLEGPSGLLNVPTGSPSIVSLAASNTYAGALFASLGLTPGIYVYTLPADTYTLRIGPAAVPEPSTLALVGFGGLTLIGYRNWFRRRRAVA